MPDALRMHLCAVDERNFGICVRHNLWGRQRRFHDWQSGDAVAFVISGSAAIAGLAVVSGTPYQSAEGIWPDRTYPHRVAVRFTHVFELGRRLPLDAPTRQALRTGSKGNYGLYLRDQSVIPETVARAILERAKAPVDGGGPLRSAEESDHARAQMALVRLGKMCGCQVWVAANDRNRTVDGQRLGKGCLEALPAMGLGPEVAERVALIDVLWLRHGAPVRAFEVEATTTVYSGLLRMSDLLVVVPAIKMSLYVVAPSARASKVRAEVNRPTFHHLGLDTLCRYITAEDLLELVEHLKAASGYLTDAVVDTIAQGLGPS